MDLRELALLLIVFGGHILLAVICPWLIYKNRKHNHAKWLLLSTLLSLASGAICATVLFTSGRSSFPIALAALSLISFGIYLLKTRNLKIQNLNGNPRFYIESFLVLLFLAWANFMNIQLTDYCFMGACC